MPRFATRRTRPHVLCINIIMLMRCENFFCYIMPFLLICPSRDNEHFALRNILNFHTLLTECYVQKNSFNFYKHTQKILNINYVSRKKRTKKIWRWFDKSGNETRIDSRINSCFCGNDLRFFFYFIVHWFLFQSKIYIYYRKNLCASLYMILLSFII